MRRYRERVVLVTGAGSGIGRATVERLADEGASLVCADINGEAADAAAAEASARGVSAIGVRCDVSDEQSVTDCVAAAIDRFGRLDVLVNNAGIGRSVNSEKETLEDWERIIRVNLTGNFLVTRACLPHLLETKGNIVNMASNAALTAHPYMAAYAASKGGVAALTYTLAVEFGKKGLRVNAVCPGGILTPIRDQFPPPDDVDFSLYARIEPLDQNRGPEAVASLVAFLGSDDAAHVNGVAYRVDGATSA